MGSFMQYDNSIVLDRAQPDAPACKLSQVLLGAKRGLRRHDNVRQIRKAAVPIRLVEGLPPPLELCLEGKEECHADSRLQYRSSHVRNRTHDPQLLSPTEIRRRPNGGSHLLSPVRYQTLAGSLHR